MFPVGGGKRHPTHSIKKATNRRLLFARYCSALPVLSLIESTGLLCYVWLAGKGAAMFKVEVKGENWLLSRCWNQTKYRTNNGDNDDPRA